MQYYYVLLSQNYVSDGNVLPQTQDPITIFLGREGFANYL